MSDRIEAIGGKEFQIGRLNAIKQLHIARRLAPFMAALVGVVKEASDKRKPEETEGTETDAKAEEPSIDFMDLASGPLADVLAEMPDKDVEYIVNTCLQVCRIKQGEATWAPLMTPSGQLMFQDLSMMEMLSVTGAVIRENLGGFFSTGQPT